MSKEKEEFLHVVLGRDSDFRYGYDDVKEIFVSPDRFEGAHGKFVLTGDIKAFIAQDNELVFPDEDNTKFELYDVEDNIYNVRSTLPLGVADEQGLVDYLKETYTDENSVHKVHQRDMAYDYFKSGAVSPTDFYHKYPNYTESSPLSELDLAFEIKELARLQRSKDELKYLDEQIDRAIDRNNQNTDRDVARLEVNKMDVEADRRNIVMRYQLDEVNKMLGSDYQISELWGASHEKIEKLEEEAYEVPNIPGVSQDAFEQAKSDFGCEITADNVDEFMKELDLLADPGLCR